MSTEFEGRVAFITGGGTGIGAEVARQFAAAGGIGLLEREVRRQQPGRLLAAVRVTPSANNGR